MVLLGIDPGLDGGLAFIEVSSISSSSLNGVKLFVMPTYYESKYKTKIFKNGVRKKICKRKIDSKKLNEILISNRPDVVFIEKVSSRPGEGNVSSFTFGFGAGLLEGLMVANNLTYYYVSPVKWSSFFAKEVPHSNPKIRSQMYVDKYYPDINFFVGPRSKVPHSGLVDAFMIGLYGKLHLHKNTRYLETEFTFE
ncbi:MAG: hypothetical protein ABIK31_05405 [candidate division WOR-3 bacterium]